MDDLETLTTDEVLDLLSKYTAEYTKTLSDHTKEKREQRIICKVVMKALQVEIESRTKREID
jgi:hypothetical protein